MERRKALAVATAATLTLGTVVVAAASLTGASILGFGGTASARGAQSTATTVGNGKPPVVVRIHNIYDRRVVDTTDTAAPAAGTSGTYTGADLYRAPAVPDAATPSPTTTTVAAPVAPIPPAGTTATTEPDDGAAPPTTAHPTSSSTTTIPTTTPTTRPRGVPPDWPPDEPIPPMPANCREPHLALNGVWHCDD